MPKHKLSNVIYLASVYLCETVCYVHFSRFRKCLDQCKTRYSGIIFNSFFSTAQLLLLLFLRKSIFIERITTPNNSIRFIWQFDYTWVVVKWKKIRSTPHCLPTTTPIWFICKYNTIFGYSIYSCISFVAVSWLYYEACMYVYAVLCICGTILPEKSYKVGFKQLPCRLSVQFQWTWPIQILLSNTGKIYYKSILKTNNKKKKIRNESWYLQNSTRTCECLAMTSLKFFCVKTSTPLSLSTSTSASQCTKPEKANKHAANVTNNIFCIYVKSTNPNNKLMI